MNFKLLVCRKVIRKKFEHEVFCGEDNIFAIVKSGEFVFDDGNGNQTVGENECVIFKKGIVYKRKVTKLLEMYLFRYRAKEEFFQESKVIFKDTYRIKSTIKLLDKIEKNYMADKIEYKKILLADIFNQYKIENECKDAKVIKDDVIWNAVEKINKNFDQKLNLQQIAKESYLSYIQFSRRFKNAVGLTPMDYLNSVRMERARSLLCGDSLSVKDIALECGFANEYYFSKFFKNYNNVTPSEYRKMCKLSF